MMVNKDSAVTEDLISCFFGVSETLYRSIAQKYDLNYISGLSHYKNHRQVITEFGAAKGFSRPFIATVRFEPNRIEPQKSAIEINFHEDQYALSCHVIYNMHERLPLEDLLKAAKKTHAIKHDAGPISNVATLEHEMEHLSNIIRAHMDWIISLDSKLLERALVIKETLLEHNLRKTLKENMENACIHAAHAFMKKNYVRVVELLSPYKSFLNTSDLKKLRMAREKIAQSL